MHFPNWSVSLILLCEDTRKGFKILSCAAEVPALVYSKRLMQEM